MSRSRCVKAFWLATFLALPAAVVAQQGPPHIGFVYPAGGQRGTTFQVQVGGQVLDGVSKVYFSGAGIQASTGALTKPLSKKELNALKAKLDELQKAKMDAETRKQIQEIRKKIGNFKTKSPNPAIGEVVALQVTVSSDAEPGQRELRLETPRGISNPLVFCVGQLPEFREPVPQKPSDEPKGGKRSKDNRQSISQEPSGSLLDSAMEIKLPAVVNGQIKPREVEGRYPRPDEFTPGDVDRYRFSARKGQQLVVAVSARQLIPYLADAVPGWFQAAVTLYDAQGKELAYDDDYRFHPDPVLFYKVPADGQYVIVIKDALYRGRADFVYRMTVGEVPFITSIFPLGGPAGGQTSVELKGYNLPVSKLTMDARGKGPGVYPLSVRQGDMVSNSLPFAVDGLPECLEKEPNDAPQTAQPIALPVIVNGRIDRPGDWDVFRFEGRKGDQLVAEVYARRLDSPLDSVLKLTDAAGKQLAFNDDHEDKGDGLNTHQADSLLRMTLPADGTYYLYVGDAQQQGGREYAYRLRITAPQPDFALRIAPSSFQARAGSNIPITVYALRKDGFAGEIALSLHDAPDGFALAGAIMPAGQDQVRLTLTTARTIATQSLRLCVEGRATIAGREVVRRAVPAEDMMQAFYYRHLVPAEDLWFSVTGRSSNQASSGASGKGGKSKNKSSSSQGKGSQEMRILSEKPVRIPSGGTAQVRVSVLARAFPDPIQIELSDPPEGITVASVSPLSDSIAVVLQSDAEKAKPGLKGNLILNAYVKAPPNPKNKKIGANARTLLGALPAIPFEIVPHL